MMNIISHLSSFASRVASTPPSAVPGLVFRGYTTYLCNYEQDSWVAKIASSYRLLSLVVALPIITLALLDIVSYGIARTLGIVDVVESSTSDQPANTASGVGVPLIHIHGESPVSGSRDASSYDLATEHIRAQQRDAASNLTVSQPEAFYASESDGLKLAGADVFSPAVSVPPSPTLSRKPTLFEGDTDEHYNEMIEGLRRRLAQGVKQGH